MKKLLLQMLACGIFSGTLAQTTINNDKWVLKPNKMKTTTGRVVMTNKTGGKWLIYFYTMADNKYVTSFNNTNNKGVFVLQPGNYRITLNDAEILNVPVQKGHDTELRVGLLNVEHNDVWHLLDEGGGKFLTSGNKPDMLLLPVGNYTIEVGNIKKMVTVNAATVEANQVIDAPKYQLYPVVGDGRTMVMPRKTSMFGYPLNFVVFVISQGNDTVSRCGYSPYGECTVTQPLPEGTYDLHYVPVKYGSYLNTIGKFIIKNLPVKKGYETRPKFGEMKHGGPGLYAMWGADIGGMGYFMPGSYTIPMPIGEYHLKHFYVEETEVEILHDKITSYVPTPFPSDFSQYVVKPAPTKDPKRGRLVLEPGMTLLTPNPLNRVVNGDTLNYIELPAGQYSVRLNNILVIVQVKLSQETKVVSGKIKIKSMDADRWEIKGFNSTSSGTQTKTLSLPIGFYKLTMGTAKDYLIKITEGSLVEFVPDTYAPGFN